MTESERLTKELEEVDQQIKSNKDDIAKEMAGHRGDGVIVGSHSFQYKQTQNLGLSKRTQEIVDRLKILKNSN